MEFTLLWAVGTSLGAAYLALRLRPIDTPERPLDRLIGAAVVGMFVGRIAALVGAGINPLLSPGQIILVRGGVDTLWAALAGGAALLWPLRSNLQAIDNMGPVILAALSGWHGGCVWRGTCLGAASELPWAWALPGSPVTRHPVELYAAAILIVGAIILSHLRSPPGTVAGLTVATAGLARLLTEPVRPSLDSGPVYLYAVAVGAGILFAWWSTKRPLTTSASP